MSDYETRKGKCKEVMKHENESYSDFCIRLIKTYSSKKDDISNFDEEDLRWYIYDNDIAVLNKNYAYVIISEDDIDDYADIFNASKNEDGTIDFLLKYYNGGCSFDEALTTAIDKMNKI